MWGGDMEMGDLLDFISNICKKLAIGLVGVGDDKLYCASYVCLCKRCHTKHLLYTRIC